MFTQVFLDAHGYQEPNGIKDLTHSARKRVEQVSPGECPAVIFCDAFRHLQGNNYIKVTYQLSEELRDWFSTSLPGHWGRVSLEIIPSRQNEIMEWHLRFIDSRDAALFKLAWGGR